MPPLDPIITDGSSGATALAHARLDHGAVLPGLLGPLQHLTAAAELLDRQRLTPEARTCARAILQSSRMLLSIVEDLRQLGEARAGAPASAAPVLIADLAEEVESLWRLQSAPASGRLLISCTAPARLMAWLSAGTVKQLLNVLITRGLQASTSGVVEVGVGVEWSDVSAEAALTLALRHDAQDDRAGLDTGLILAETLARSLGGALSVSANPGGGETIALALPTEVASADEIAAAEEEDSPLPARTHLLIVDDNATNRTVASALCEMFGCTTQTADDGVEAVEAARASRFDLILMDIKMPRMDGIEATQAIRRLPGRLGRVPIVALTANGDAESTRTYLACGMDAVVEKPIKPDKLLETLQWALDPERNESSASAVA